ncbi:MAG TPA: cyclic nucleotide-binding protein [Rhodospirillaceae bacterium]|nr:cyclic nucleotide-binding protein [Rhodospirillaceae bacterium]
MSLNEEVEVLRSVPLFAKIEPSKLKLLAFTSERLTFPAGGELFHQGDPGEAAYIILSGQADVVIDTPTGEMAVAKVGKNDLVGEIAILIDVPRTATIRAETEITTLAINKDLFFRMISEFPGMAVEIMRELAHRLEATTAQLREASNG